MTETEYMEPEETLDTEDAESVDEQAIDADSEEFRYKAKSIIEAVLFAAGYPVKYEKIASVLGISAGKAREIVREYAKEYNGGDELPRGVILLTFDDACQLCTKEEFGMEVREALGIRRGGNLSPSSIEVLAIIAYNEPVTRAYVDTVRGVDSSYAITSLSDKHLIEVCGRLDVPGRPLLYRTTDDFLRVFGMQSLSDLPEVSISTSDEKQQTLPDVDKVEETIEE
ncbi:MAG: SMC-Scp complex subunit ScpB [Clostridia bacterium]|nr:SMC-Scp complex subunit ScpB [Clostridia bacterium]